MIWRRRAIIAVIAGWSAAAGLPGASASDQTRTITVWAMGAEGKLIRVMADRFEMENPGVKVLTQAIPWEAAHEKLVTAFVGGMSPDVAQIGTTWMPEFQHMGALEPLDDFAAAAPSVAPNKFFEGALGPTIYAGRRFGIPWYVDTRAIFYRTDLIRQAGFKTFPKTWAEFHRLSLELVRRNSRPGAPAYAFSLPTNDWQFLLMFLWQNGGEILPSGRTGPVFAPGGLEGALTYLKMFFDEKLAPLEPSQSNNPLVAFETGYFPVFLSGPWMIYDLIRSKPQLNGRWATAALPAARASISFIGGCDLVIFKQSANKPLAWKFIEFMSRSTNQARWFEISKTLPAVKDAWKSPDLAHNAMLAPFKFHLESARSAPVIPEWESVAGALQEVMEQVMFGRMPVEEARGAISGRIRAILDETAPRQSIALRGAITVALFLLPVVLLAVYFRRGTGRPTRRSQEAAVWFLLPAMTIIAVFLFIPVIASFAASLTNWNLYGLNHLGAVAYVGFDNYLRLFRDPIFLLGLRNTLAFSLLGVPLSVGLSLFMAMAVNRKFLRGKAFFRVGFFIPVITTMVAVAIIWRWLYNPVYGVFNLVLDRLNLAGQDWLTNPHLALPSLILMGLWKGFGYNTIIFVAAMQSIPESLYESIEIDGASTWQRFWFLTLPMLRRTTFFVLIMTTIGYLQFFAEPYIMTGGGPLNSTMSVVLYMYQHSFKFYNLGYASAMAYVLFAFIFAFTLIQRHLQSRWDGSLR